MADLTKSLLKTILDKPSQVIQRKIANSRIADMHRSIELWAEGERSRGNYGTLFNLDALAFKDLIRFQHMPNIQFLEIGCFLGFTSNFLVDNFLQGSGSKLTCIDPWINYSESTENTIAGYDTIINNETYALFSQNTQRNHDKLIIHRGLSKEVLPSISTRFHFVFIDGDHSTSAVWKDAVLSISLLVKGGFILFDDYDWSEGKSNPKEAIDYFESYFKNYVQKIPTYNNQRLFKLVRSIDTEISFELNRFD